MPKKIFRLHSKTVLAQETHWVECRKLDETMINSIMDDNTSIITTDITSIPSPFARFDLVMTAFKEITKSYKNQTALQNNIYYQIVSDCLDVAEIFCNRQRYGDKINVKTWSTGLTIDTTNKTTFGGKVSDGSPSDLNKLLVSNIPAHNKVGETLKLFLVTGAETTPEYNFNKLDKIHIIEYKYGNLHTVIGGTSPTTLFFAPFNCYKEGGRKHYAIGELFQEASKNNSDVIRLSPNGRIPFGDKPTMLYQRDRHFIEWIFQFFYTHNIHNNNASPRNLFKPFYEYIKLFAVDPDNKSDIAQRGAIATFETNVANANVTGDNTYAFLGCNFPVVTIGGNNNRAPLLNLQDNKKVIVFPNDSNNQYDGLDFIGNEWTQAGHRQMVALADVLKNNGDIAEYFTIDKILEEKLYQLPYKVDGTYFANDINGSGFLLPIKSAFFEYFNVSDLQINNNNDQTKPSLFITSKSTTGNTWGVKLTLPLRNNPNIQGRPVSSIVYEKDHQSAGVDTLKGALFTTAIYPFFKVPDQYSQNNKAHYRVMLIDRETTPTTKDRNYTFKFYKAQDGEIKTNSQIRTKKNEKQNEVGVATIFYEVHQNFDYIQIFNGRNESCGLIIPIWDDNGSGGDFNVAVDFGTTNTHIAFIKINDNQQTYDLPVPARSNGYQTLHKEADVAGQIVSSQRLKHFPNINYSEDYFGISIDREFLPAWANNKFPFTTSACRQLPHQTNGVKPLISGNIPFWYGQSQNLNVANKFLNNVTEIDFDLKWDANSTIARSLFMDELVLLIRNYILSQKGALKKIIWSHPNAMSPLMINALSRNWQQAVDKVFITNANGLNISLESISESLCPYNYLHATAGFGANGLLIDIGGGSTDVVLFTNNQPNIATSFKFASQALWERRFGHAQEIAGFLKFIVNNQNLTDEKLSNSNEPVLQDWYIGYNHLIKSGSSSYRIIDYLFNAENSKIIDDQISFSNYLTDTLGGSRRAFDIVFLFYYTAIIYHIAKLIRSVSNEKTFNVDDFKNMNIGFTGNGSRIFKRIFDKKILVEFANIIFKDIFKDNPISVTENNIIFVDHPKQLTAYGALRQADGGNQKHQDINYVFQNNQHVSLTDINNKRGGIVNDNLSRDSEAIKEMAKEVEEFINLFFNWCNTCNNWAGYFGTDIKYLEEGRRALLQTLPGNIGYSLSAINATTAKNDHIPEPLFFYPLRGCIADLAYMIGNDM
ncbi:MAG: hypothetical protein QM528_05135 [Phycisphaerales bacterium]|nr:hypothetical protein [Phycisphaerales bacterium]